MQSERKAKPRQDQSGGGGPVSKLILVSLPFLVLHRAVLSRVRIGFQKDKDEYVKAAGNFVAFELHALMMLLDPSGRLRSRFDESEIAPEIKAILEKLAAGFITFVEIQEAILPLLIKLLDSIKDEDRAKTAKK
jgi:hypothetical protein